jgi:hypothetical protein
MSSLLFEPSFLPFSAALVIMFVFAALEGVGLLFGAGLSNLFDAIMPDIDFSLDASPNALSQILGWMNVGKVPLLVIIITILVIFGLGGIALQYGAISFLGRPLPLVIAAPVALAGSLYFGKKITLKISKILPSDESSALHVKDFIGGVAKITLGSAKKDKPAQARYQDQYGQYHYFMVAPEDDGEFKEGESVMLSKVAPFGFYIVGVKNEYLK